MLKVRHRHRRAAKLEDAHEQQTVPAGQRSSLRQFHWCGEHLTAQFPDRSPTVPGTVSECSRDCDCSLSYRKGKGGRSGNGQELNPSARSVASGLSIWATAPTITQPAHHRPTRATCSARCPHETPTDPARDQLHPPCASAPPVLAGPANNLVPWVRQAVVMSGPRSAKLRPPHRAALDVLDLVLADLVEDARLVPCQHHEQSMRWICEDRATRLQAARSCHGCPAVNPCRLAGRFEHASVWGGRDRVTIV